MDDLSKEAQLGRSPGGNRHCPNSGELKRSCQCRSCVGRRSRRKGRDKQRATRKAAERMFGSAGGSPVVTAHEENWRTAVRFEVKSGKQVESLFKRYLAAEAQSDTQVALGDNRPFVFAAAPDGTSDQIWAVRASRFGEVAAAACPNPCCREAR